MIFGLVLSLILLFAFGTVIVIFGDSPALRNTQLFHVRQYLVTGLDGVASRYLGFNQRHFNGRLTFALGYLVPAIHMAIVTFCVQQFVSKTIPILQRFTTPNYFYISISIALIYILTYLATFTSAGEIGLAQFPYIPNNQLIFFDKKVCQTCNIIKPARSKHCSVCNGCFALYDHHCIWVNNCIGYSNYKWFMLYLLSNINFLGYGAVICFEALNYQIKSEYKEYGFWTIITSTTEANKVTGVFVILTSIFVVIVVLFLALQLKYVYLGVTTNEADKWSAVEFLVLIGALYKLVNEGEEIYLEKAKTRDGEILYITLQDEQIVNVDESQLVKINSVEDDLINIYDHGFWDNFKERIFTR